MMELDLAYKNWARDSTEDIIADDIEDFPSIEDQIKDEKLTIESLLNDNYELKSLMIPKTQKHPDEVKRVGKLAKSYVQTMHQQVGKAHYDIPLDQLHHDYGQMQFHKY